MVTFCLAAPGTKEVLIKYLSNNLMCKEEETRDVGKGTVTSKNWGNLGWTLKLKRRLPKEKEWQGQFRH